MIDWISVKDRLPNKGDSVLVWLGDSDFCDLPMMGDYLPKYFKETDWRIVDLWGEYKEPYNFVFEKVTHWAEITPPEDV